MQQTTEGVLVCVVAMSDSGNKFSEISEFSDISDDKLLTCTQLSEQLVRRFLTAVSG